MEMMLLPGLLAAGVGSLIFVGLNDLTGFGTFSLNIPQIPHVGSPTGAEFLWAVGIGLAAAVLATNIFRVARLLRPIVEKRRLLLTPVVGLAVGGLAIAFAEATGRSSSDVLFSGQSELPHARPAGRQLDGRSAGPAPGSSSPWPTPSRSAVSAAGRSSRRCSSVRPAGSPSRTFPVCP